MKHLAAHRRRSPCCEEEARRYLATEGRGPRGARTPMGEATFGAISALRELAGEATKEADRLATVIHDHRAELRR